ncbi:hypothetical protein SLE2022_068840 [Rubroshorea leprosula]
MKRFYRLNCFLPSASSSSSSSSSSASSPSSAVSAYDRIQVGVETLPNCRVFSYDELRVATDGFHPSNKSGEGGFGSVYKGKLQDGIEVAVKVLSAESVQGDREFMSEIASISNLKHTNLVKLHGCCIYGPCRILVYDFMQNNSLAQVLHGGEKNRAKLSWKLRTRIAEGVAEALAYIHEEVKPHIIHRDIKPSNILLDQNLTPKLSDFGLSKLFSDTTTHISTRVAGTLGYIAPEYAISGQIVGGRTTIDFDVNRGEYFLVEKAWEMYKSEELLHLVDPMLNGSFYEKEAVRLIKVGLLCVQEKSGLRPHMSTVIKMMNGEINVDEMQVSRPGIITSIMDVKIGHRQSSLSSNRRRPCSPGLYS